MSEQCVEQQQPLSRNAQDDEGEEESVYVVLELQGVDAMPEPGSSLRLEGMVGTAPVLTLPDGTPLVGHFEETVGTQLVFGDEVQASDGSHRVQLVAHTDKRIVFSKLQQASGGGGVTATRAGAGEQQLQQGGTGQQQQESRPPAPPQEGGDS